MTEVLSTAAESATSSEFNPIGEFFVQCDATSSEVIVDVLAKIENAAAYATIDSFQPARTPIKRYAKVPYAKVTVRGNSKLATIKVHSVAV